MSIINNLLILFLMLQYSSSCDVNTDRITFVYECKNLVTHKLYLKMSHKVIFFIFVKLFSSIINYKVNLTLKGTHAECLMMSLRIIMFLMLDCMNMLGNGIQLENVVLRSSIRYPLDDKLKPSRWCFFMEKYLIYSGLSLRNHHFYTIMFYWYYRYF